MRKIERWLLVAELAFVLIVALLAVAAVREAYKPICIRFPAALELECQPGTVILSGAT